MSLVPDHLQPLFGANYASDLVSVRHIRDGDAVVARYPGMYTWYFSGLSHDFGYPTYSIDGWQLLYVGIARRRLDSKATLHSRIVGQHLGSSISASTLRFSLAYLLRDELTLQVCRTPGARKSWRLDDRGERALNDWLDTHARVRWLELAEPWTHEEMTIGILGRYLPLNIRDNQVNVFACGLKRGRTAWRKQCLRM